tara:strand:+ start:809 stop:1147 length:339 start_codon:yes stop_codon:yes gene_type:complete
MTAATYDVEIDQGSDFAMQLQVSEDDVIRDLTGYSARGQIRQSKNSSTVAADFVCSVSDPELGKIDISLANASSSAVKPGVYFYDIEIYTANDASVTRLIQGTVSISQEVTR